MSNAKHMTSAYDMQSYDMDRGSLSLWNYARQPREAQSARAIKVPARTQLSIMRDRLEAVQAMPSPNYVAKNNNDQHKTYHADALSFHASPMFKNEEAIERVVNVLLIMTILFVVAWISISIIAGNNDLARRSIDMSSLDVPASTGFAPVAAANFLPEVGGNIDLDTLMGNQIMSAPASMHMPVPPPSLEQIEAMEADDGSIPSSTMNDQLDI